MDINKPIGIPSGWEEIAAFYIAIPAIHRLVTIGYEPPAFKYGTQAAAYDDMRHDWRVEA